MGPNLWNFMAVSFTGRTDFRYSERYLIKHRYSKEAIAKRQKMKELYATDPAKFQLAISHTFDIQAPTLQYTPKEKKGKMLLSGIADLQMRVDVISYIATLHD